MKYRVQNMVNNEYLDDDSIFLLPNGEVGWFIRDGSYPHYRKFRHQEDFNVINEDCERLQKKLEEIKDSYIDLTTQDEYGSYYIEEAEDFVDTVGRILKEAGLLQELNK